MWMEVLLSVVAILMTWTLKVVYDIVSLYWLTPMRIRKIMERQGVRGPKPRPFTGNIHEIASMLSQSTSKDCASVDHDVVGRLLPHYVAWSKLYGKRFLIWSGTDARLCLSETELVKELLFKHNSVTGKSWLQQQGNKDFVGRGLFMSNGQDWRYQRHLTSPAFTGERVKGYAVHMVDCAKEMMEKLREEKGEVDIGELMHTLTADIISRTLFGGAYEEATHIFGFLYDLQRLSAQATRHRCYPGSRFFPSKYNRQVKSLKAEVESLLMAIIKKKKDGVEIGRSSSYGNDLLGILLKEMDGSDGQNKDNRVDMQFIMDECKTFIFAGHETTALLLTWTLMLLADNPTWQNKVRDQVREACGPDGVPSLDQLPQLTLLNMVINESLRLYPTATIIPKMVFEDIKLGDLTIPKGISIWIPVLAIHHSEELWGKDANEFNPDRFATRSYSTGRHFLAFSAGPRNCIGQSFAMMEAKIILAMLISKYSFTLSENYRHAPVVVLTIKPKHGVQMIVKPLDS